MKKAKTIYLCTECGASFPQWLGRCTECGEWNSVKEERLPDKRKKGLVVVGGNTAKAGPVPITELESGDEDRISSGLAEFDRVLGGGMVKGSAVLIGGEPGIGKSTLLLQVMGAIAARGESVLYVTGEESARQVRLRGERLGQLEDSLIIYPETSVEATLKVVSEMKPSVLVVDSVQTLYSEAVETAPGSVGQVREVASILIAGSRALDMPVFLVGHVTKDGFIAGPKMLEHMVDTVLYLEGESSHQFRVLRAAKNRYGSSMEIGVFEMAGSGLREVTNPSEVFLAERPVGASGSVVVPSLEGSRTILVEIQALVSHTPFGVPRRTVLGVDYNRVLLLAAVLEKRTGTDLSSSDIFLKVAGGMSLGEPAADLGVISAIVSNHTERAIDAKTVVFGEVGLAGEVRAVSNTASRVTEALRLGFSRCILPKDSLKECGGLKGIELIGVSMLDEAIDILFGE